MKENLGDSKFTPVLQSERKTEFIGFIMCLHSMLNLHSRYIETNKLECIE